MPRLDYVRFALEQPAEYRIVFGREAAALEQTFGGATLADSSGAVMDLLQGGIRDVTSLLTTGIAARPE